MTNFKVVSKNKDTHPCKNFSICNKEIIRKNFNRND